MGTTATADPPLADDVAAIRAFSRFYTGILGVLDEGLLETPYTLTEARLLYELAQQDDLEVVELRRSVGVDGGYLSRLLSRFHADGLIRRTRSVADGRRQVVQLTKKGRSAFEVLNGRSADQVGGMLASLDLDQRRRLVGAMNTIESLLGEVEPRDMVVLRPLGPGDHGWIVQRHGLVYAQEFGWDETFEGLVARIMADFVDERERDPKRVAGWIAEIAGEPVGCVLCVAKDATTAQLRLLLVDPMARGSGIGGRLIDECIRFARRAGYTRLVLWTNDVLTDARRLYDQAGFHLTEENPHHSFGHDLVGQTLALDL